MFGNISCLWYLGKGRHENNFAENMIDLYQEGEITELKTYGLVKFFFNLLITQEAASIAI